MRILFSILTLITMAHVTAQDDPVISILPKLEVLVHNSMHRKQVPGMAVAVVSKGKVIYVQTFGVRAFGQPAPINQKTLFPIGSLSKPIASTLIAILNREQEISLDHPIDAIPGATLRHILSHTTGIPSAGFNALIERGGSFSEAQQRIQALSLDQEPGVKFAYHNVVYSLLANVIEGYSQASFETVLQKRLLQPLHMTGTSSTWHAFISQENRVAVHVLKKITKKGKGKGKRKGKKDNSVKTVVQQVPYRKDYTNFPAAGGVSSNIHDMALFLAALLGARPDVISRQDLKEFMHPIVHTPDQWHRTQKHRDRITKTQYGLGWRHMTFAGRPVVFHGGWLRGFCQMIAFLPDQQVGIVILQNAESSLASRVSLQFLDWVLGLPPKKWVD